MALPVNCHIHLPPNFSAFSTIAQAVEQADREGLRVLGASNYYDHRIYSEFSSLCRNRGIIPLEGIEIVCWDEDLAQRGWKINDPGNPGKVYLCGKSLRKLHDPTPRAKEVLETIRTGDQARTRKIAENLSELCRSAGLSVEFSAMSVEAQTAAQAGVDLDQVVLQERHLAQALQEMIFSQTDPSGRAALFAKLFGADSKNPHDANGVQNEIRGHLMKAGKPAYTEEKFISRAEATDLIQELEGVVCYPVVIDGMKPNSEFEQTPGALVENLQAWGISHAEFIPNRNSPEALEEAVRIMTERGITVSAGTEHNTKESLSLRPQCHGGAVLPPSCEEAFYHGARMLAAWQAPENLSLLEAHEA